MSETDIKERDGETAVHPNDGAEVEALKRGDISTLENWKVLVCAYYCVCVCV